jgi:hypothetical protein
VHELSSLLTACPRAIDQDGKALDIPVQPPRNTVQCGSYLREVNSGIFLRRLVRAVILPFAPNPAGDRRFADPPWIRAAKKKLPRGAQGCFWRKRGDRTTTVSAKGNVFSGSKRESFIVERR